LSFDGNQNNPRTAEPSRTKKKILDEICFLKVLTIIFSLYGYDGLGLGFPRERKKRLVSFLSTILRVKVAVFLRVREKSCGKIFKVEENLRVWPLSFQQKGETAMKKQYRITTIGTPNIEKMSTAEQKSFYSTLLVPKMQTA